MQILGSFLFCYTVLCLIKKRLLSLTSVSLNSAIVVQRLFNTKPSQEMHISH